MRILLFLAAAMALVAGACGPVSHGHDPAVPRYAAETSIRTAGHRCQGSSCACRPLLGGDQEEARPPAAGHKRYEIRLPTGTHPAWVEVKGLGVVFRPAHRAEETCVYVDFAPGDHEITYVGQERERDQGFPAILRVYEYGSRARAWYEAFLLDCGVAEGRCTKNALDDWIKATQAIPQRTVDPCSSTRFAQLRWGADRHEGDALKNLALTFTLKVYKFVPTRPPRSRCEGGAGRKAGAEPAAEGEAEPAPAP
jgi:hypothetical protein